MVLVFLLSPFTDKKKISSERVSDLPKTTQPAGGWGRIHTASKEADLELKPNSSDPSPGLLHSHPRASLPDSLAETINDPQVGLDSVHRSLRELVRLKKTLLSPPSPERSRSTEGGWRENWSAGRQRAPGEAVPPAEEAPGPLRVPVAEPGGCGPSVWLPPLLLLFLPLLLVPRAGGSIRASVQLHGGL